MDVLIEGEKSSSSTQSPEVIKTMMTSDIEDTLCDSGVQMLDSESTDIMNVSMLSSTGIEMDTSGECLPALPDLLLNTEQNKELDPVNNNNNIGNNEAEVNNELVTSTYSTFDANENIVYRRKVKNNAKQQVTVPKKRVSFHEDILKSTRTDNIHIEHGFVTYKGAPPSRRVQSWCSDPERKSDNYNYEIVYRNACSDVLDYGQTNLSKEEEEKAYANRSGIFEYVEVKTGLDKGVEKGPKLYKSDCSDSNSSLDSVTWNSNTEDQFVKVSHNYAQTKSNSCDCIGEGNNNSQTLDTSNCFFSEPNIDKTDTVKSVWSKERKPKSSCLKKSKHVVTNVIHETPDRDIPVKKFNIHHLPDVNNIIDNGKTIFGSLKNIFGMPMPERGVPEGSEDAQSVTEFMTETENNQHAGSFSESPFKSRTFLSKSLDRGFTDGDSPKKYVHNVDEQLRRKTSTDPPVMPTISKVELPEKNKSENSLKADSKPYRNKYIINLKSTVFEHTGVSYEQDPVSLTLGPADIVEADPEPNLPFLGSVKKLANMFKRFKEPPQVAVNPTNSKHIPEPTTIQQGGPDTSVLRPDSSSQDVNPKMKKENESSPAKSRHLESPMRKKTVSTRQLDTSRMSPDIFNNYIQAIGDMADEFRGTNNLLNSTEFDDILTVTTNESDKNLNMVIVDYPDISIPDHPDQSEYLRPSSSKSSLINRFLRHVTQRNIMDARLKQVKSQLDTEKENGRLVGVIPGVRPNEDLVAEMNAEIAMEIEQNSSPDETTLNIDSSLGVGEVVGNFSARHLPFMNSNEVIKKVYKLFAGYSRNGEMIPVLVFLTQKTMYVSDLVRSRLCTKFVLPYAELDVILMEANGSSVLLSNSARDMQQVLLVGGSSTACELVSNLEYFARKQGLILPAVGVLTLNHYHSLQRFVHKNTKIVAKDEEWKYYGIVSTLPSGICDDKEPMGPHLKGPLMYRKSGPNFSAKDYASSQWSAGYFLLKAGVLYMFSESVGQQKLPNSAIPLTNCQGARRTVSAERPHCFELLFKGYTIQLAASDEYAASEWLQSLIQSASGLFEWQEKHFHYGCTLIMTTDHIITLRENFEEPLCRVNKRETIDPVIKKRQPEMVDSGDSSSDFSSSIITSSTNSKQSSTKSTHQINDKTQKDENSNTSMSTSYGKNSGIDITFCVPFTELLSVKVSSDKNVRWCTLEFTCREITEHPDDLVFFFATESEQNRFMSTLKKLWQIKTTNEAFPIVIAQESDPFASYCTKRCHEMSRSWEPLISAALGYPQ